MKSPFFDPLSSEVSALGGFYNAHLHLCRAGTYADTQEALSLAEDSHLSLSAKHGLIPLIHNTQGFKGDNFKERMLQITGQMIQSGTTRADTLVDISAATFGTYTFEKFLEIKEALSSQLQLNLGAYCPLGFSDSSPENWNLFRETAKRADFIASLPERDDQRAYPNHIGFKENVKRVLEVALEENKPIHIHVDQKNDPAENDTERVLDVLEQDNFSHFSSTDTPQVWLIHVISPSAYEEPRFNDLLARIKAANAGVICCPSAAISMRQLRQAKAPTHNSIARVLEFLAAGIPVRIASDNINDITSPAGTTDLMHELFVLCNLLRFYHIPILAKIAAGVALSPSDRQLIQNHLAIDKEESAHAIAFSRK